MFWKFLAGAARSTLLIQRTVSAIGVATIVGVGLYDFLKSRNNRR